jgi:flagellar motility protein MotE (MotC chaperone)
MDELNRLRKDIELYELDLEKSKQAIEEARQALLKKIVDITESEMKNLKVLAGTYSSLTPVAAVSVFKEMDDQVAVKILSQMKPEVVAAIFEEMSKTPEVSGGKDGKTLSKKVAEWSDKMRALQQ